MTLSHYQVMVGALVYLIPSVLPVVNIRRAACSNRRGCSVKEMNFWHVDTIEELPVQSRLSLRA